MINQTIEEKRNKLNIDIRSILSIIDLIDGKGKKYEDYTPDSLNEEEYLNQQLALVSEAKERLLNIFKE